MSRTGRHPRLRFLSLGLAFCLVAALGWGTRTYVGLVRLEASVADSCARVETASRIRLELVENLVRGARASIGDEGAARLGQATERVREIVITPDTLDDAAGYRAYRLAQADLSAALSATWGERPESLAPSAGAAMNDIRPELERWSSVLEQGLAAMERQLGSYRSTVERFPGSLIAGILEAGGTSGGTPRAAANRADASKTGPRAVR